MIRPLSNRIVVRPVKTGEVSPGGILLPEQTQAKELPLKGEIVAVGPGEIDEKGDLIPVSVEVGQVVIFNQYAGTEIEIEAEKYLLMRETDLIGLVG